MTPIRTAGTSSSDCCRKCSPSCPQIIHSELHSDRLALEARSGATWRSESVTAQIRPESRWIDGAWQAAAGGRAPWMGDGKIAAAGGTTLWTGCGRRSSSVALLHEASTEEAMAARLLRQPSGC